MCVYTHVCGVCMCVHVSMVCVHVCAHMYGVYGGGEGLQGRTVLQFAIRQLFRYFPVTVFLLAPNSPRVPLSVSSSTVL